MDCLAPNRVHRAWRYALVVLASISMAAAFVACDEFARVEINNDAAVDVSVSVNGKAQVIAPAGQRIYTGPGVNERLGVLEITLLSDPIERKTLELHTYDDDLVIHVTGPPLEVIVTHERHPSARKTEVP